VWVDGGAKVALDLSDGEVDWGAGCSAGGYFGVDEINEFAFELSIPLAFGAAVLQDDLCDQGVGDGGGVEVCAALEAVGGVGVEAVAAPTAANGGGVEPCGFDEDVFCLGGDHGVPAAHDSG